MHTPVLQLGEDISCSCHCVADEGAYQISHVYILGASSPAPLSIGPALLCCPGEVQGLLSHSLLLVRGWVTGFKASFPHLRHHMAGKEGRASSPILTSSG